MISEHSNAELAILKSSHLSESQATHLAQLCHCPCLPAQPISKITSVNYILSMNAHDQLYLQKTGAAKLGPVYVDFLSPQLSYRQHRGRVKHEPLIKAMGVSDTSKSLRVLDCTAGLGIDGFLLAAAGCQVHLLERSTVMSALLENGLTRALQSAELTPLMHRLSHQRVDAKDYLSALLHKSNPEYYDVIYLDPMFSMQTKQKGLVKKGMQYLRHLLPDESNLIELFLLAHRVARYRVVIKRPRLAPVLDSEYLPTSQQIGKRNRFDLYAKKSIKRI